MINTSNKSGIFRKGFLSLLLIIFILIALYLKFFLDIHLAYALRTSLTRANCAEVNVRKVETKLLDLEFNIYDLEISNFSSPDKNLLGFEKLHFTLNADAALRMKKVIENSKLDSLTIGEKRKHVAKIYPKCKAKNLAEVGLINNLNAQKDELLKKSALTDLIKILKSSGSIKDKLKNLKYQFKTEEKIKELKLTVQSLEADFNKNLETVNNLGELKGLLNKAKSIKISKNPLELAKQFTQFKSIKREFDQKVDQYKKNALSLKNKVSKVKELKSEVINAFSEDQTNLKKYLKLPELNLSKISEGVFDNYAKSLIAPYMSYWNEVESKLPEKISSSSSQELKPRKRARGVNIHFPVTKGYPDFLLKNLDFTSTAYLNESEKGSIGLNGFLKNISSSTLNNSGNQVGTYQISGDLPQEKIEGFSLKGKLYNSDGELKTGFSGNITSFPIERIVLSNSSSLKLIMDKAVGGVSFEGELSKLGSSIKTRSSFKDVAWDLLVKDQKVDRILQPIFNKINKVDLKVNFQKLIDNTLFKISSDFDQKFKKGINGFMGDKLSDLANNLKKFTNEKIGKKKDEFLSSLNLSESQSLDKLNVSSLQVGNFQSAFESLRKDFENKQKEKAKKQVKKKLGDELNKLKNKIKLPF